MLKRYPLTTLTFLLLLLVIMLGNTVIADEQRGPVIQLTVVDVIGPATDDYIARALESAQEANAELIIIRMDTPGGLDTAMRGIIKNITNSTVPIATYVAPTGARAASAGTYILYASHVAAMAPGTNLGAATPVQLGGMPTPKDENQEKEKSKPASPSNDDAKRNKVVNDAVAYIRGLAELHGRNQEWAEKAVREAASLQASEALKLNVIDFIASSVPDLLQQLDSYEVTVMGQKQTLQTDGLTIVEIEPDWRSRFLSVITNPNIAYILMLIGIYGLIFEFSNPGSIVPGTVGAIALLLALYSFQLLPINYAGVALILLGVALMVGEAFQPSFGMLGIGGTIAFVIGSIILMDTDVPGFGIDISIIVTFAALSVLVFIFVIGMAIKARRRPVVSGMEELVGGKAIALEDFEGKGAVSIHSERWNAVSEMPLRKGQALKVKAIKGLILQVEPADESNSEESS